MEGVYGTHHAMRNLGGWGVTYAMTRSQIVSHNILLTKQSSAIPRDIHWSNVRPLWFNC
jgi:hypothetical protein